jgi:hypothetical protein
MCMYFVACMAITTCNPHHQPPFTWRRGPFSLSRVSATFDVEEGRSDAIRGPHRATTLFQLHSPLPSSSAPAQSLHIPPQHYHHSITPKYPSLTLITSPSHRTNFTSDNQQQTRSATREPTPHHLRLIITRPEVLQPRLRSPQLYCRIITPQPILYLRTPPLATFTPAPRTRREFSKDMPTGQ